VAGIAGNLMGYTFLDLVAAAVVGVMIAHMGGKFALEALAELVDTGLAAEEVEAIRATLLETPGVRGLHELRTRKMADNALVDAHVLVDPKISVSEGHFIAESARQAVLRRHHVLDVMVHIDPEDDARIRPNAGLPSRRELLEHLAARMNGGLPPGSRITLHYLDGKVEADLFFDSQHCEHTRMEALKNQCAEITADDPYFRSVHLHCSHAQK
jgi:hypothetical protein